MTQTTTTIMAVRKDPAPVLKDGSDQATAKHLSKLYSEAQNGMRRIVALGLFAWEIKELKLKHGQFGPWLAAHCPKLCRLHSSTGKPQPTSALQDYMSLTKSVLEKVGFTTVEKYLAHVSNPRMAGICQGGKFLLLPPKKVPDEVKPLREKIFDLVDGKTQNQLFLEFKQADEDGEKPKRGRLKGQGGASKEQRAAAAAKEESARIEALELDTDDFTKWLDANANEKGLGQMHVPKLEKLVESIEPALAFIKSVLAARKGGAK